MRRLLCLLGLMFLPTIAQAEGGLVNAIKGQKKKDEPKQEAGLTANEIKTVIRANMPKLRECYEATLKTDPELSGKIPVKFEIGADGKVLRARKHEPTITHRGLIACVVRQVKAMQFPKLRGGGTVKVTFPFVFQPE